MLAALPRLRISGRDRSAKPASIPGGADPIIAFWSDPLTLNDLGKMLPGSLAINYNPPVDRVHGVRLWP